MRASIKPLPGWASWPVSVQALAIQLLSAPLSILLCLGLAAVGGAPGIWALAWGQGTVAAVISLALGLPWWWWLMQLGFWPLLLASLLGGFSPGLAAGVFLLLLLIYGGGVASRVPLFLSSRKDCAALLTVLPQRPGLRVLDAGAGLGSVLAALSHARPDLDCQGVERAWLPWLCARLRLMLARSGARVARQNLYALNWGDFDVVYAYLSPAPMADVWRKVCAEMHPGSIFISNSFAVPDVEPDQVIDTHDWHGSRLLIWYR